MQVTKWGLFKISRSQVSFTQIYGLENNPRLLIKVLPFGSLENNAIKYTQVDNMTYFSYFRMNGQAGKGLVFAFPSGFVPEQLFGVVSEMPKLLDNSLPSTSLDIEVEGINLEPIQIKNFETAVFSVLARRRTIILGEQEDIIRLLITLYSFVPGEMKQNLKFVSYTTSLSENVYILGMPFTDEVISELEGSKGQYTVIILGDQVYGQFTSHLCKKIDLHARTGQYRQIKDLLEDFHQIIRDSDNLPPALEFAARWGLHLSDAQLALIMRANYFGREVPHNLLEA
ncbi:MAG: hypothetical protein ACFFBD_15750 [Candidatus Hodarchaeota archaeon]